VLAELYLLLVWAVLILAVWHPVVPWLRAVYRAEDLAGGPAVVLFVLGMVIVLCARWVHWLAVIAYPFVFCGRLIWRSVRGQALMVYVFFRLCMFLYGVARTSLSSPRDRFLVSALYIFSVVAVPYAPGHLHLRILVFVLLAAMLHLSMRFALWNRNPYEVPQALVGLFCKGVRSYVGPPPQEGAQSADKPKDDARAQRLETTRKWIQTFQDLARRLEARELQGMYFGVAFVFYFGVLAVGFASVHFAYWRLHPAAFAVEGQHAWVAFLFYSIASATTSAYTDIQPTTVMSHGLAAAQSVCFVWLLIVQILNMTLVAAPRAQEVAKEIRDQLFTLENEVLSAVESETGSPPDDAPRILASSHGSSSEH